MKKIVSYLTIISLLLITFSCGGGGSGSAKGVSSVTVLASFEGFKSKNTSQRAASSTLTNIRYTVSGSGMETMTDTVPVTGNLVEFTLNVPNGLQRHFLIEALDSSNYVRYSGEAYKDLDGTPVTIEITLVPTTSLFNMRDYFPLGQGDTWVWEYDGDGTQTISGTETINGVDAVKMITGVENWYQLFTNSNGITYYKRYDANDIEGCGWSQSVFIPPITLLPAEVSIGVKYTSNFTTYYTNCTGFEDTETSSTEASVEGIEDVTVPAGTFKDCLKIKIKGNNLFSDTGQVETGETTWWLAKGVGKVKETEIEDTEEDTSELVSATVGGVSYPSNDTTPPSVPTNLTTAPFPTTQIDLSWNPSTDNVAMAGYKVYDSLGTYLKSVTTTSTSITGLTPDTQYCFTVSAYDTAGN